MVIKAIFFDLDDTLHDNQKPFTDAINTIFPVVSKHPSIDDIYKTFRDFSDRLWVNYINNELTLAGLRERRIMHTLKNFEFSISLEEARRFQSKYEENLKNITLFPNTLGLLNSIKKQGINIGIITNGPTVHQMRKITSLGLTEMISREFIFISDEVGKAKPNPEIFHYAAQRVTHSPKELLYIGDSWANDIVGSSEAGWHSIWFNHRKREPGTQHKPLGIIEELSSILNILT